jgi:hypothetical protein
MESPTTINNTRNFRGGALDHSKWWSNPLECSKLTTVGPRSTPSAAMLSFRAGYEIPMEHLSGNYSKITWRAQGRQLERHRVVRRRRFLPAKHHDGLYDGLRLLQSWLHAQGQARSLFWMTYCMVNQV